jgi:metal-responsive CopG/Arc/MetJ family transcriptional regulator
MPQRSIDISVDSSLVEDIDIIAREQNRSRSEMMTILCRFALNYKPAADAPSQSWGCAQTNLGRRNEERRDETIKAVQTAISELTAKKTWKTLNTRQKAALISQTIKKKRGAGISTQTLYLPEIRPLWNKTN